MWSLEVTAEFTNRQKWYSKKRPHELQAVLDNLDSYHKALQNGTNPQQAKFGFIHPEPKGVLGVDQKGGGANLKQTRLYTFPDPMARVLYLVTLGDKKTQKDDLKYCGEFVDSLQKKREGESDDKEAPGGETKTIC